MCFYLMFYKNSRFFLNFARREKNARVLLGISLRNHRINVFVFFSIRTDTKTGIKREGGRW